MIKDINELMSRVNCKNGIRIGKNIFLLLLRNMRSPGAYTPIENTMECLKINTDI